MTVGRAGRARAKSEAQGVGDRLRAHRLALGVLAGGVVLTGALVVGLQASYLHQQQRITSSQTALTAASLGVAQVDLNRRLGEAVAAAAEASHPSVAFDQTLAASMHPKGPFVSASLRELRGTRLVVVAHLGAPPIRSLSRPAVLADCREAIRSGGLVTDRVVAKHRQRLLYYLATSGQSGTFVAAAAQALPGDRRVRIPPSAPYADLNAALYYGRRVRPAALIEASTAHLPLSGITARAAVPLGSSVITLVASPKGSLMGAWAQAAPWALLAAGLVLSVALAVLTDRLVQRRRHAEVLALENRSLYREQRGISETLQRALLPRRLPEIAGVEMASLYLSGIAGLEVGGDWYSVITVDADRFAFVVGDVSGRGVRAATVMASLRYTIRALAALGFMPEQILELAGREINLLSDEHFATVLVGLVDNRSRQMRIANAGHLPPLLIAGGRAEYLELPIGPPLGVATVSYAALEVPMPERATLLAYTDGLVERRDASLDTGLEALRQTASQIEGSVQECLERIVAELVPSGSEDDLAALGLRWGLEQGGN
ncbi:MAG: PP2C family protein-serine/threonine phosphatase [Actinomycetota bacterium]|nr:PP2C family protein-serine/threonine phosphatase [Actinomycetota bacterium]